MNKYLSSKIRSVSFICIIFVVFLHCYNFADNSIPGYLAPTTIISDGLNYGTFIEYFICNGFTRVAVPLFFMISGYLFYLTFDLSLSGYFYKVKSRFMSLLVPYLVWTLIGSLMCLIFWSVDIKAVNCMKAYLESGGIVSLILNPPAFQFWFLRQLLIYVVISPVIYLLLKCKVTRGVYLIGLFALWCMNIGGIFKYIVVEALLCFSVGAYLEITKKENLILKRMSNRTIILSLITWITLLTIKTVMCGVMDKGDSTILVLVLYKISELIGIFTVWFGMDKIIENENINKKILGLSKHTFFIFCFHEPILDFIIQYTLSDISNSRMFNLITFLIYPTVTIILGIVISNCLIKYMPFIHNILSGSRGTRKKFGSAAAESI